MLSPKFSSQIFCTDIFLTNLFLFCLPSSSITLLVWKHVTHLHLDLDVSYQWFIYHSCTRFPTTTTTISSQFHHQLISEQPSSRRRMYSLPTSWLLMLILIIVHRSLWWCTCSTSSSCIFLFIDSQLVLFWIFHSLLAFNYSFISIATLYSCGLWTLRPSSFSSSSFVLYPKKRRHCLYSLFSHFHFIFIFIESDKRVLSTSPTQLVVLVLHQVVYFIQEWIASLLKLHFHFPLIIFKLQCTLYVSQILLSSWLPFYFFSGKKICLMSCCKYQSWMMMKTWFLDFVVKVPFLEEEDLLHSLYVSFLQPNK